jgi:hypothetical protein
MQFLRLSIILGALSAVAVGQDCSNTCPGITCSDGVSPVCTASGYWVCPCTIQNDGAADSTCYQTSDCGEQGYTCVESCCVYAADCSDGACLTASDCGEDTEDWSCPEGCCVYSDNDGCAPPYNYDYLSADGCSCALGDDCQSGSCSYSECTDDDNDDGGGCGPQYNGSYQNANGCACDFNSDCQSGDCEGTICESDDPVVIDLSGAGFALTNAQGGVKFDFFDVGKPIQMAWTAAGADVGWLALDRNGNGKIDDGAELFSNMTPQPPAPLGKKVGFRALAIYDLPANGGNGDGLIDKRDAVFSKLLVWVDKNHNGVSDPGELLTMEQAGIQSISLSIALSTWVDAYGNQFRYRSKIAFTGGVPATDQYVYDVILVTANTPAKK